MNTLEDLLSRRLPGTALSLVKRSRLMTRLAWKALRFHQDLTSSAPNEHRQLEEMEPAPPPGNGPTVLVFSLRGWTTHLAWETTLARALHLRGAATHSILCDRVLPACEPRTVVDDFASTCDRCVDQSSRILRATGLPFSWLGSYLEDGEPGAARSTVEDLSIDELRALEESGIPIGRHVAPSVNRHLLRSGGDLSPEYVEAYRRFTAAGLLVQSAARRIIDRHGVEIVFVLNGLFYAERILLDVATRRGLPVWSYERAKRIDSLIAAKNLPVLDQTFDDRWPKRSRTPLTSHQEERLDKYLQERFSGNVGIERLWDRRTDAGATTEGSSTAVLFTNVLWDTAVFDSEIAFDSMAKWVTHSIEWFRAHPERRLIIRIHPAEVRVPFKLSRDPVHSRIEESVSRLPSNVRVVRPTDPVDSYALVRQARLVLVYASTIGLEAAVTGTRTIVAGATHYRGKGFTRDPSDPEQFDRELDDAFIGAGSTAEEIELARRYAYLYFFEEIIPFSQVREHPRSYVTFTYRTNEELRPGVDEALDALCDSILTGSPLRNPRA